MLLYTDDGDATSRAVVEAGFGDVPALVRRAGLEDVFLILTGRALED